jgi:hypothetical protein
VASTANCWYCNADLIGNSICTESCNLFASCCETGFGYGKINVHKHYLRIPTCSGCDMPLKFHIWGEEHTRLPDHDSIGFCYDTTCPKNMHCFECCECKEHQQDLNCSNVYAPSLNSSSSINISDNSSGNNPGNSSGQAFGSSTPTVNKTNSATAARWSTITKLVAVTGKTTSKTADTRTEATTNTTVGTTREVQTEAMGARDLTEIKAKLRVKNHVPNQRSG